MAELQIRPMTAPRRRWSKYIRQMPFWAWPLISLAAAVAACFLTPAVARRRGAALPFGEALGSGIWWVGLAGCVVLSVAFVCHELWQAGGR